jgi:hypothetical protein
VKVERRSKQCETERILLMQDSESRGKQQTKRNERTGQKTKKKKKKKKNTCNYLKWTEFRAS